MAVNVEVGMVYNCYGAEGKVKVKILSKAVEHSETFCETFYFGAILRDHISQEIGLFTSYGVCSTRNIPSLLGWLEEFISPEKQSKLDKINEMEKQLAALKQEVEKE